MKKVLAWAVALALVLSSFTMAFAADTKTSADFSDASQIQYTEAVDVMVATGVINGYPDGTFGPLKTVKRSEMAKMISVMLNGGTDIGDQYKDACTFGDSKTHWAAGYIAYCAAQHIIDGRSADVFDPDAEVTGTEVAKMALTSLGYDSKIQGYTGEQWAANVLKDANKIDLFDGLKDFTPGNPCSREAAAQILFNTLKATKVEYQNGTSVSVGGDVNVVVNSQIQDVTKPASKDQQNEGEDGYGTIQLWEDVFGSDLTKNDAGTDSFGRPAHTWLDADEEEIGTYGDEADKTFVTEENQTLKAAIADYNEEYDPANATVKLNGAAGSIDAKVPAGTTVEITKTGNNVTLVVAYYYQLVQISGVDTDVSATHAKNDVTAYVDLDGLKDKVFDSDIPGYDASTYVEDAYIAVVWNAADKKVLDSYVPESKQGEITKTSKDSVYVDGTAYLMSTTAEPNTYVSDGAQVGDTVDLYLDKEGNALGTIVVESEDNILYGVLTDVSITYGGSIKEQNQYSFVKKATLTIFDAEGNEKDYKFSEDAKDAIDELNVRLTDDADETTTPSVGENILSVLYAFEYGQQYDNGVMIEYTLDDEGNVDTMDMNYNGSVTKKSMNSKGIMDGNLVNEDIVIFAYDEDAEAWTVFAYEDLANAEDDSISGPYFTNDDGMAALWATEGLVEASEDTIGFFVEDASYTVKDGSKTKTYYEVTLYVDGKKVTYDTIKGIDSDYGISGAELGDPVVVSLNSDDEITAARPAVFATGEPYSEFAEGKDGIIYAEDFTALADAKTNKYVAFTADNWIGVAGAQAYKLSYDSEGEFEFAPYTGSYKAEGAAMLLQIDAESEAWDIVIYMTPADYEKYLNPSNDSGDNGQEEPEGE